MRIFLAILMALHGIAHVPGVLTSWRVATFDDMPYRTTIFGGQLDVGDAGMRVAGALWLLAALGFTVSAAGAFDGRAWWPQLAVTTCVLSLGLCLAMLPQAKLGIPFDLIVLAMILFARRLPEVLRVT